MTTLTPSDLPNRAGLPEDERALQEEWRARYAPEVKEVLVHRLVPSPKLTVIVVSYRARDYLIECLQHVRGQTVLGDVPFEVLLADSGGIEHLRPRTASLCDVDLRLSDGIPLNAARNAAMAWARGEYVAIVDDDGLVAPTFVEVICRLFEDPRIAAARGRIIPKEHPYFCTLAGHYDRGDAMVDDALLTEGHMAIRRRIYLTSGGFPDAMYGHEGIYLLYRITRMYPSLRVVYAPDLVMRHDYFDSFRKLVWKARKYSTLRETVGGFDPGGDFERFLDEFHAREMPKRALTPELLTARALLRALRWGAARAPEWVIPKR